VGGFLRRAAGIVTVAALASLIWPGLGLAKTLRVALVPLKVHSTQDLSFLVNGIQDMLASRLASEDIRIIEPSEVQVALANLTQPLTASSAMQVALRLKADFVIYGSLTQLGQSYSLNWQILKASEPTKPSGLARTAGEDQLISTVDEMAGLANEVITGKPPTILVARPQAGLAAPAAPKPEQKSALFFRPGATTYQGGSALGTFQSQGVAQSVFTVKAFMPAPVALAIGDLDGDKNDEVLLLTDDSVAVYSYREGVFAASARFKQPIEGRMTMISAGDVDGDGRAEIALSSVYGEIARAALFKVVDNRLREVASLSRRHLRIINTSKGPALVGQASLQGNMFIGDFIRYTLSGGKLIQAGTIPGAREIEFPTLALADLTGDGSDESVGLTFAEKLSVVGVGNRLLYRSGEKYGGTNNQFDPRLAALGEGPDAAFFVVFNAPLIVADIDKDGKPEVLVVHNEDSAMRMLAKMAFYKQGSVFAMSWQGSGLAPAWRTPQVQEYVCGAGVAQVDGGQLLVMAGTDPENLGGLGFVRKVKGYIFTAAVSTDKQG